MTDAFMFPHTCWIQRITTSVLNAVGQETGSFVTQVTGQECHYQPGGTRELAGRIVTEIERPRIFFPHGTDIAMNDRITHVSAATNRNFIVFELTRWDGSHIEATVESDDSAVPPQGP